MSKHTTLEHGSKIYLVDVIEGKWKYRIKGDISIKWNPGFLTSDINTEYYRIVYYKKDHALLVAKAGYAFDGITGASWLEDPDALFKALFHDILMQAVYDNELIHKKHINDTHKIFLIDEKNFKSKFIYHSLMALHKPWNKVNSLLGK